MCTARQYVLEHVTTVGDAVPAHCSFWKQTAGLAVSASRGCNDLQRGVLHAQLQHCPD